jgi:glucan phosphoethanolaminetransferase (alkaline phosphatase superfamily)
MGKEEMERKKLRAIRIAKSLFTISAIYLVFLILVILLIYYFEWMERLEVFLPISLQTLIIIGIAIYAIFIIAILLSYASYRVKKKKLEETKGPSKHLFIYTHPEGARGGIFSRTVIKIDDDTAVNIKYQMVKPEELWL